MMQRLKILGSALIALSFSASAVVAQQFDPKQGYEIHTVNGLVLDNQESLDTNTKIFISKREADKESQVWNLIPCEQEGCYTITSPLTQMNVDNSGKGKVECSVIQWSADPKNPNQQWKITALPNGNYPLPSLEGKEDSLRSPVFLPFARYVRHCICWIPLRYAGNSSLVSIYLLGIPRVHGPFQGTAQFSRFP